MPPTNICIYLRLCIQMADFDNKPNIIWLVIRHVCEQTINNDNMNWIYIRSASIPGININVKARMLLNQTLSQLMKWSQKICFKIFYDWIHKRKRLTPEL